jgi:uncharacterized protein (DUF58 family)
VQGYIIFIFIVLVFMAIGEATKTSGFKNLTIRRECDKQLVNPGEEFKMTVTVENRKWLPISFLYLEEELPSEVRRITNQPCEERGIYNSFVSSYSVLWYERLIRTYVSRAEKRGVYLIRNMNVSVGDVFGFSYEMQPMEDVHEVVVLPKLKSLKTMNLQNNSIQGESIVKRWIYKDPLYVKGIREYNIEDRMKDIHWKSSLRMNKLMVKDYDHTSEREMVMIVNVQAGKPYWRSIDGESVERGVELAASLAQQAISDGVPTGLWTNAQVLNYKGDFKSEVSPSLNSFKSIMELCARIDSVCRIELAEYINRKAKHFNKNTIYVLITSFLDDETMGSIRTLRRRGLILKLIDTSSSSTLPEIDGIEKINCGGGIGNELI